MTASTETTLALRKVTKFFGRFCALKNIELDVRRGEFVTLLGPSGSGKSTTLMLVAGFETPSEGEIVLDGRTITRMPPHRRRIGLVFQNYALFPHLSVFENLAFSLRNLGWRPQAIADRVHELLELIELGELTDRLPGTLSGGQQQRVALARALAFRPSLLLLDEPIAALDKRLREQMLLEFRRIHRILGTTMIFVTHDQEEALVMSDRIVVMDRGEIVQVGTPHELYEKPRAAFVAEFLGHSNILHGHALVGDQVRLDGGGPDVALDHSLPQGTPVAFVIRPEKIVLGRIDGWNHVEATVDEVLYLGGLTRYQLTTASGKAMVVAQLNHHDARTAAVGERVPVAWSPADARMIA